MNNTSIIDEFKGFKGNDEYKRVGTPHHVAWYVGFDEKSRYSLFCIVDKKPPYISSIKLIDVFVGQRKDGKYGITFSLNDAEYLSVFSHFCEDMIEYSRKAQGADAADIICSRYIIWVKGFTKTGGERLSFEEIKGLIGELLFLKQKMIPRYGQEKALESWCGIEKTDQDFVCDNTWYEVKSTVTGANDVKISSVEQLDVDREGHLAVVYLDKTSEGDAERCTLNSVSELVIESFDSELSKEKIKERLLRFGYYASEIYDQIGFRFNGMDQYLVGEKFPCLRKKNIPVSVNDVTYDLSLPAIETFKEEE